MNLDLTKITDIEFDGIDWKDSPDFVDSYISKAYLDLGNGQYRELTETELDSLNDRRDFVYEKLWEWLY